MSLTPKISLLLLTCVLFMVFFGVWALFGGESKVEQNQKLKEFTRQKRGLQDFRSHIRRVSMRNSENEIENGEWNNQENSEHIDIHVTNLEDEEKEDHKKDQKVKQALMKMMNKKLKETKVASKQRRHFDNAPGLDFRREFASDEPNPYIENLRNRCEQA
ncbi:uncharacterized protein LOC117793408 [Drosophila innubila]|uniref:uncharacterized protein LOC117793408 n=1 Tax=Drosophila innubila TaxID=198719 RepID=UPI00148C8FC7|nr:uncharacterized protein LOC117793408 [Drosophila innubila]